MITTLLERARLSILALSLFWLSGCTSMLSQSGTGVPVVDGTDLPQSVPEDVALGPQVQPEQYSRPGPLPSSVNPIIEQSLPASSPAVIALLNNAEKESQAGRNDHAAASIERALGLEPQSALLWSRLAAIRLDQGNLQQAVVLAGKSNSLLRNDRNLQFQNWRIIELAKTGMGDVSGAAAARQMISKLASGR